MTEASSYLRYLPPALWEEPHPVPALPLGAMLRIFEKILTGIEDDAPTHKGKHPTRHDSIEAVIDRLHRLFDPWQTPAHFLPWLASWVGLELPPVWDEYQKRKAIAEITRIYPRRGPKEGLDRYLDLYTVAATRPRITVDDSAKVLFAHLLPDQAARVHALVTQGPFIREDKTAAHAGLVSPQCIALTPDGDLLVGDSGMAIEPPQPVKPGLWRITRAGRYADVTGAPPKPRPLGQPGFTPGRPIALAVDERANPWSVYLLDANSKLHRLVSPGLNQATTVTTQPPLQISLPVAMALSRAGQLLILDQDRGVTVVAGLGTGTPQALPRRVLTQVLEPRSLLVRSDGNLIIGDAREQNTAEGAEPTPADLILVDRRDNQNWVERRLLESLPAGANPLVAPVAIVEEDATHLLVVDIGLKPEPDANQPFRHDIAEPAAVFRVDLGTPPSVARVTELGQFVYPKGLVLHDGTVYLCDPGESHFTTRRVWRALAHEFGVLVHFSKRREPVAGRAQLQKDIMRDIEEIVHSQKPAAALVSVIPRPEQIA